MAIRPFHVDWSEAEISRVVTRVAETRLPQALPGAGWSLGCDADFLTRLQAYWAERYDPAAAMTELNRYPQFIASVDGQDIHFVHVQGENPGARPMILTHGWPGSHAEFWDVVEPLAFPSRHGGDAADAIDLVIPSLPGFGFSAKPTKPVGPRETARLWNILMTRELGFASYFAQGGDGGRW